MLSDDVLELICRRLWLANIPLFIPFGLPKLSRLELLENRKCQLALVLENVHSDRWELG
jgi:hypothetical protein